MTPVGWRRDAPGGGLLEAALQGLSILGLLGALGCGDLSQLAGTPALPSGVQDPAAYQNPAGAVGLYRTARAAFAATDPASQINGGFVAAVTAAGLLTDELVVWPGQARTLIATDQRVLPMTRASGDPDAGDLDAYGALQSTRNAAGQAIGALAAYAPDSVDLRAELYLLRGSAEVLLADLFCSGVPLSTLDYQGDYTYHAGSTTAEVYRHAVTQFDTALALVKDSARVRAAAAVGKGRALLALGRADSAALAVAAVPDGFQWQLPWMLVPANVYASIYKVVSGEGRTGLRYFDDPRSAAVLVDTAQGVFVPVRYGGAHVAAPFTVADWVEARLIRAEAALQAHDVAGWLAQLNYLRAHADVPGAPAGTLPSLADPGMSLGGRSADSARVDLLFRERAEWLYLTAHRQGDLRRLVRQYGTLGFTADGVYPVGPYPGGGTYGRDVTLPIPSTEYRNPKFTPPGCLSRAP